MSYPGYVLVEMDLDENTWHIVRNTPRVTGFVGSATAPPPLSESEVDAIINRVQHAAGPPETESGLRAQRAGAHCRRPLREFQRHGRGNRQRPQPAQGFGHDFGRSTPVELDFASVEKLG